MNSGETQIIETLRIIARFMSGGVGIIVTIMIVYGAVEYITAADNPQKTQTAKNHITRALEGLFLWIFGNAILHWLIPGGIV